MALSLLTVVCQIHVVGVTSLEAEGHTPVSPHGHGPHTFTVPLQWMQSKRRLAHILRLSGLIERRKDQPQTFHLIGLHAAAIVLFKQSAQALGFKALDQRTDCTMCNAN